MVAPNTSVGIATRCGPDGPRTESRCGQDFPHPSRPTLGPGISYAMGTGSFSRAKRPMRGVYHPPPPGPEIKEWVQLYLYSFSGLSWPVLGWNLPPICAYFFQVTCGSCNDSFIHSWNPKCKGKILSCTHIVSQIFKDTMSILPKRYEEHSALKKTQRLHL